MTRTRLPRLGSLALLGLLAVLLYPSRPATAGAASALRLDVRLTAMQCHEESDEGGDDDPYVVMAWVDMRSGRLMVDSYQFHDIESGEGRLLGANTLAMQGRVAKKDDLAVFVGLMEWDRDSVLGTGYITREGRGIWWTPAVRDEVTKALRAVIQRTQKAYAAGYYSGTLLRNELQSAMQHAMGAGRGDDEVLGLARLALAGSPGPTGVRRAARAPDLRYRGDGSNYTLRFEVGHTRLPQPRMLRIQVTDAISGKLLPASWQVTRGKAIVAKGSKKARIEQRLAPGAYQLRVSAKGHHARTFNVTIQDKDVFVGAKLQPTHVTLKPGSMGLVDPDALKVPGDKLEKTRDLSGTWKWDLGTVEIKQNGSKLQMTVHYPFGVQGTASGTIQGSKIVFTWSVKQPAAGGHGELGILPGATKLEGWTFNTVDGQKRPWKLWR